MIGEKMECPVCGNLMDRKYEGDISIWTCKHCCYKLIHHKRANPYYYWRDRSAQKR